MVMEWEFGYEVCELGTGNGQWDLRAKGKWNGFMAAIAGVGLIGFLLHIRCFCSGFRGGLGLFAI